MSQIKFSQKSIQGLPEALAALLASVTAQGTAGSTALTTAINTEIAARTAADTTISNLLDTVNGASTVEGSFRKAIADVIGSAPEALNTLKEIADYIAVNPNATVADAINSAISAANLAVANLTATVTAEKTYLDSVVTQAHKIATSYLSLDSAWDSKMASAVLNNTDEFIYSDASDTSLNTALFGDKAVISILNFETARLTTGTGVSFDVRAANGEGAWGFFVDSSEFADMGGTFNGVVVTVQYIYTEDGATVRTALGG